MDPRNPDGGNPPGGAWGIPTPAPPDFWWFEETAMCICSYPWEPFHFQYLMQLQETCVRCIVNLTPADESRFVGPMTRIVRIPLMDGLAPTVEQIDFFLHTLHENIAQHQTTLIITSDDIGGVTTLLACYLIQTRGMAADDAFAFLKWLKSSTRVNVEQEVRVYEFFHINAERLGHPH